MVRVVVLNRNGRRWLEACLVALKRQRFRDFEVVIVDNASHDGSVDFVRGRFPEYSVGYAAGNNAGAKGATAKYLVFLNNDTEAQPEWLPALVDAAERDQSAGLVSSLEPDWIGVKRREKAFAFRQDLDTVKSS